MKNLIINALMLLFLHVTGIAQTDDGEKFFFYDDEGALAEIEVNEHFISDHYLGPEIALKLQKLSEVYTYVEKGNAVNPVDRTIVQKPSIFYAVKKLNSYYKKGIRREEITEDEARRRLGEYLEICLKVYPQPSQPFENALNSARSQEDIEAVFARVVLFAENN